jgi:hypothetical protein
MTEVMAMKRWEIRGLTSKRVRVFNPEEVTARGAPEADPGSVGLERDAVESRRGEVILDRTIGHARGNSPDDPEGTPLVPATPDTLFNFFSGSKAITAMLIHLLAERDQLHVDEPVATFIPEFARNRKHRITIRDLLTHRGGIPSRRTNRERFPRITQSPAASSLRRSSSALRASTFVSFLEPRSRSLSP